LLLLERLEEIAAATEPATAKSAPALLALWAAEIEELRRRRPHDPNQKRNRHRQHDKRAGLGEQSQEGFRLQHAARSLSEIVIDNVIAESGRKRAVSATFKFGLGKARQDRGRKVGFRVTLAPN
jgi:hypothetical protein